jgi:hypothetical protein
MLRASSILLAIGLTSQAIYSLRHKSIQIEGLRLFFFINSLVLAFAFLSILIKTGHVGLPAIKHLTFDLFTTTLLTITLIYNFSIMARLMGASSEVKILVHRHITFIFIFLILSLIYMTLYSETTNRMELMEMIK